MNLRSVDPTFSEAHPIMSVLSNPWLCFAYIVVIILALIIAFKSKDKRAAYIFIGLLLISPIIFISLISNMRYQQEAIYEGKAKVESIGAIDNNMKRKVVLKNDEGSRVLNLKSKEMEGIKKHDEVNMKVAVKKVYFQNDVDQISNQEPYYIDKPTHKFKKHINFKAMTDLEDSINLTK